MPRCCHLRHVLLAAEKCGQKIHIGAFFAYFLPERAINKWCLWPCSSVVCLIYSFLQLKMAFRNADLSSSKCKRQAWQLPARFVVPKSKSSKCDIKKDFKS